MTANATHYTCGGNAALTSQCVLSACESYASVVGISMLATLLSSMPVAAANTGLREVISLLCMRCVYRALKLRGNVDVNASNYLVV